MNRLYLMIPAFCDLINMTLRLIALNYVSASAYQMLNGGNIITCFILSYLILKAPIRSSQVLGSALALIGIMVVGFANIVYSNGTSLNSSPVIIQFISVHGSNRLSPACYWTFSERASICYRAEIVKYLSLRGIWDCRIRRYVWLTDLRYPIHHSKFHSM